MKRRKKDDQKEGKSQGQPSEKLGKKKPLGVVSCDGLIVPEFWGVKVNFRKKKNVPQQKGRMKEKGRRRPNNVSGNPQLFEKGKRVK